MLTCVLLTTACVSDERAPRDSLCGAASTQGCDAGDDEGAPGDPGPLPDADSSDLDADELTDGDAASEADGEEARDAAPTPEDAGSADADEAGSDASQNTGDAGIADTDAAADASGPPLPLGADFCKGPTPTWDVLMTSGVTAGIVAIDGDRLLVTNGYSWTLWQPSTGRQIATLYAKHSFPGPLGGDLVGDKFLTSRDDVTVELRSTADGALLATFDMMSIENAPAGDGQLPRLSNDASYVWQQADKGMRAWSLQGDLLFQRSGNYALASVYAAPDALLIANGPAGSNVIERVTLTGASSTAATFAGTFSGFFDSDPRFFASDNDATTIYSSSGVLQHQIPATGFVFGNADLVMVGPSVYRLGQALPLATYEIDQWGFDIMRPRRPRGMRAFYPVRPNGNQLTLVSLLGDMPVAATHYVWPNDPLPKSFSSSPDGRWATRAIYGLFWSAGITKAQVEITSCGSVTGIAGSASGHLAVATNEGRPHDGMGPGLVRIFHLDGAAPTLVRAIAVDTDYRQPPLALSSDGRTLLSVGQTLRLHRLPDADLVYEAPAPRVWALASQAERLAQGTCSDATHCSLMVTDFAGTPTISAPIPFLWADASQPFPRVALSPDGTRVAILNGGDLSTAIYADGVLVGESTSGLRGWLGSSELLLQSQQAAGFADPIVTNAVGITQRSLTAPGDIWFRPIDEQQFYDANADVVYASTDGHVVWQGDTPSMLANIAGRYRVTVSDGQILLAPWR